MNEILSDDQIKKFKSWCNAPGVWHEWSDDDMKLALNTIESLKAERDSLKERVRLLEDCLLKARPYVQSPSGKFIPYVGDLSFTQRTIDEALSTPLDKTEECQKCKDYINECPYCHRKKKNA